MKKLIIANWKTYLTTQQAVLLCDQMVLENNIIIAPAMAHLSLLSSQFPHLKFAAQDISSITGNYGAYTGETSAAILKDMNINYAIIGHSERRAAGLDNIDTIIEKIKLCATSSIIPIICIGESLEDRKSGKYKNVITSELHKIFQNITSIRTEIIIAYEPFWSIGTGVIPLLSEIEEIMGVINETLNFVDNRLFLVYGGSVNAENAKSLISMNGLDGLLIGKASFDMEQFKSICNMI